MHGNAGDRRALEREALRNVIAQWNANRLDIFELSEPNEDLEFHGVMRFYFQDSGQKVATKCIRVASDATVEDVIGTLVEKFRPDMRMLSVPSYALYELHQGCPERKMSPDEKPLLVQLNWHVDDREGRFLLRNVDDRTSNSVGMSDSNASFRRKLSKREKKQLKKQEKQQRLKSENGDNDKDGVAEKLYTELPETSFTRSISNPEAVMRRRRQQKLEKKLQQFRSKDGGPDTGGTLKIYGEALCKDVPYKTLLLSIRDCAGGVVREMLEKYGLSKSDPSQWCLVQVTQQPGVPDTEYVLDDEECPLSILMNSPNSSSIMFHVRRRPADCAPRKRKKKPGALGANAGNPRGDIRGDSIPILVELGPDGSAPLPGDTARTVRLNNDVMEVGSANGIALQLYGPHIQPRHCVITNTDGVTSLTPCHADAHTYVNGQRIHQTTILAHGSLIKFGNSNTYRFLDPSQEDRSRHPGFVDNTRIYDRSPRALSPIDHNRENFETTFDLEGNVETVSTASGPREDNRSLGSSSENRVGGMDRYPRGHDPILPAVLEFPEEPQELFLARVITHLDVTTPTFRLAPAYTLYLCARYRASTHYRPELTPTERAQKLTLLLQHAAKLVRHTVQDRSTESVSQAFWLANASELLHFLKSDRHVSAFSMQAQDTLADSVQLGFRNLVACLTDELNSVMGGLMMAETQEDHPREIINVLSNAMNLLRKCRVNAALTIQLFSQLFHWISARSLSTIINNSQLCTRSFGTRLFNRLRNLQAWAESQGLELAAECHLAKIVQCAHLLQAPKSSADELATLSAACFKLNSLQLRALLTQYKGEPGEQVAPPPLLEHAARAAEGVADELARAEGREVKLHEDSAPPLQLLLPDDGFSCDVVQGVPPGLADFLHPLQASGLCRLAAQPTSSGHWTVYMTAPRPPSALSASHTPEIQTIRLHKAGGGMGLSIVAAKGAGQERLGIYIKSVVPGGAADRDGRLAAGDQLLSVDGQSLLGITQEKAAEFLVRTGSVVTLDVAKGGAVYHGLATLLQQPSPTPHRASDFMDYPYGSQEYLYDDPSQYRIYTPPVTKPKNNVFFNSDDNLYKTETRKLTIPRIEIESSSDEPEFKLQITDFSDPDPKDVTFEYEDEFKPLGYEIPRSNKKNFYQQKSYSLDIANDDQSSDAEFFDAGDAYLTIGNNSKRLKQISGSLQDLSSSTSSINTVINESTLDLSIINAEIKQKYWKSPDEIRQGHVRDLIDSFEYGKEKICNNISNAVSVPNLNEKIIEENLGDNKKWSQSARELNSDLTEREMNYLARLLQDWSVNGSEGINPEELDLEKEKYKENNKKSVRFSQENLFEDCDYCKDFKKEDNENVKKKQRNLSSDDYKKFYNCNLKKIDKQYHSAPDLSPGTRNKLIRDNLIYVAKYKSDNDVSKTNQNVDNLDIMHKCQYRNCIFNSNYFDFSGPKQNIINNIKENFQKTEKNQNVTNDQLQKQGPIFLRQTPRRYSEIIETNSTKQPSSFQKTLIRYGSLERLSDISNTNKKKFPESYIVRKPIEMFKTFANESPKRKNKAKTIVLKTKIYPKTWKSCSDIKNRQRVIKKCCKNANVTCPILKSHDDSSRRMTRSCADVSAKGSLEESAGTKYASFDDVYIGNQCPRRMSERDLPSRVDAERTIPSSKSVPALHHISPNAAEQPTRGATNHHDVFNPGYSRTSSNNSINNANNNGTAPQTLSVGQNGGGPAGVNNLRSRSTHNLLQQDGGFYQNLSVYRNKIPQGSQQLGDRTSALRSSQNSLQSNITNAQRPASAYYPNSTVPNTTTNRLPLHQSIPNLKSSQERTSSYPSINQQIAQQQQYPNYNPPQQQQAYQNHHQQPYQNHHQQQQHPYQQKPVPTNQYQYDNQSINNYRGYEDQQQHNKNYQTYPHSNYPVQQPLHINANGENDLQQQREMNRYNTGLLREDYRHIAAMRDMGRGNNEEMMRYPSSNNVRIQEAQIQPSKSQDLINRQEDFSRNTEMRTSKSEDMLRQYANSNDMYRYASSGNIKDKIDSPRQQQEIYQNNDAKGNNMRGQAKLVEMGEEVRRRQNRSNQYPQHGQFYQNQNVHNYVVSPPHHVQMAQNTQSMQNLNLSTQNYYYQNATSPNYVKNPPIAPKPLRKMDDPPELPPTSTHPLYSASSQEPPKMSLYSPPQQVHSKSSRGDPWAREEQERQAEIRREQARLFREQQIKELMSTPNRTQQQEEHLRVLQLERDFQRRALEEAEQEDDDTEKESPVPSGSALNPPVVSTSSALTSSNVQQATSVVLPTPPQKQEPPASILKPGVAQVNNYVPPPIHQQEPQAPPPPERGSSYTVMSMRNKEGTKRVSFDTSTAVPQPPQTLQLEETIREDPNSFIRQAETMLASPTTPNESAISTATPGVIGAQEVYKDPRTRRLAEQAQQKAQAPIPEKLSFKEKMKMFAMETGEAGTPKDKSKISRAQREIDNLASPNSSLVH
nr:afadin isoform X2 [Onthophagus taurus]